VTVLSKIGGNRVYKFSRGIKERGYLLMSKYYLFTIVSPLPQIKVKKGDVHKIISFSFLRFKGLGHLVHGWEAGKLEGQKAGKRGG